MIKITRNGEETSQKIIGMFLKRVKKSNLVARKRKTQIEPAKMSFFKMNKKAVRKAQYLEAQAIREKIGKK
jgi:hypothetical protein